MGGGANFLTGVKLCNASGGGGVVIALFFFEEAWLKSEGQDRS
jgi:hypothetical protein